MGTTEAHRPSYLPKFSIMTSVVVNSPTNMAHSNEGIYVPSTFTTPPPMTSSPPASGYVVDSNEYAQFLAFQEWKRQHQPMAYSSPSPAYAALRSQDRESSAMYYQNSAPVPTMQKPPVSSSLPPRMPPSQTSSSSHPTTIANEKPTTTPTTTTPTHTKKQSSSCNPFTALSSLFASLQSHGEQIRNLMSQARSIGALLKGCQG